MIINLNLIAMKARTIITVLLLVPMLFTSCVSKKEYLGLQGRYDDLQRSMQIDVDACRQELARLQQTINSKDQEIANKNTDIVRKDHQIEGLTNRVSLLERELDFQKQNNTNLLDRLSELSVLSTSESENVRKTLESLNQQSQYVRDLTSSIQRKDSLNLVLVMNLKRSLDNINDEDIQIEVKKGVVYISISDKLLFKSGSYEINTRAIEVLGKVAKVINDHKDIEVMVEGHTDSVPISTECMKDNWDLSVKRATAVIRVLQWRYNVAPERITAAGRSEFLPKDDNATEEGRANNRRTEIIITPKLDQFFNLLQAPEAKN